MKRALVLIFGLVALALLTSTPVAHATDQVVSNCGDSGTANQLRAKINDAQSSGGGTITFTCGPTVTLNGTALPTITSNITIDGGNTITLSGANSSRLFNVESGATLSLNNITLTKGYANDDGGAIYSTGTLLIYNSKFLDNHTAAGNSGGAILSRGGMNISYSEFANNSAENGGALYLKWDSAVANISYSNFHQNQTLNTMSGWGGAILVFDGASATINYGTLRQNDAGYGGAIYVYQGPAETKLDIEGSTLDHNGARNGGAIYSNNGSVSLYVATLDSNAALKGGGIYGIDASIGLDYVTASDNTANTDGGGIYNEDGSLSIRKTTLNGNYAYNGYGGGIYTTGNGFAEIADTTLDNNNGYSGGGAIASWGKLILVNATLSSNWLTATDDGAGIYNAGYADVENTLIAKGTKGLNCKSDSPTFDINVFNLSDDNSCAFGGGRDSVTLPLGPLTNNGGLTLTRMPQANNPAIDGGTGGLTCTDTDQRGVTRPQGLACDVGAVEVVPTITVQDSHPFVVYDGWRGNTDSGANGGAYRFSKTTNDTLSFRFTGTSIKWLTAKSPSGGKALVTIDGVTKCTCNLYNGSIVWTPIVFDGLSNARHRIVVKVTGTKSARSSDYYVVHDGFIVGSSATVVQETANSVRYNKWVGKSSTTASGGTWRVNGKAGAAARLGFYGISIRFITAKGPQFGKVNVYIDGVLKSSNLDLYASQPSQFGVTYAGLSLADHLIEVKPAHIKNPSSGGYGVPVDAFVGPFTVLR